MIGRWNQVVTAADDVYHLGDFTLSGYDVFQEIVQQLKFRALYIVPGGHDKRWIKNFHRSKEPWADVVVLEPIHYLRYKNTSIVLCHYPLHSWEKSHYGSLHLHGHCHGTIGCVATSSDVQIPPGEKRGQRVDVGVDCWNFYPVHIDQILGKLKSE